MKNIQIALIDSNPLQAGKIQHALDFQNGIEVRFVFNFTNEIERYEKGSLETVRLVILNDASSTCQPFRKLNKIENHFPNAEIIVITTPRKFKTIQSIWRTPITALVDSENLMEDLYDAISACIKNRMYLSHSLANVLALKSYNSTT